MWRRTERMEINTNCSLAAELARRMREGREELTRRWLERIAARVDMDPNRVFPTNELLDHVPLLMDRIADYLQDPADEITADAPVIGKALELGELRWSQGFDAHQILKEYEILGGVLFQFLVRSVDDIEEPCTRAELLACAHRLFRAVAVIQQLSTEQYLRLAAEAVREREERLRSFNRMVTHELKNRIGSILGAGQLLEDPEISADPARRARFAVMVTQNADAMQDVLQNLLELSKMDVDARRQRNVPLPRTAAEVCRQLREMSQSAGVKVRIEELPEVEVNSGAVELCLTNYVSNAIKYADPRKPERWVRVWGEVRRENGGCEVVVAVEDNGLGVPEDARAELFSRFYRAHGTVTGVEGTGLGLSIVRETIEGLGGRAWAEFDGVEGSRFLLSLPCRRSADRGDVGTADDNAADEVSGSDASASAGSTSQRVADA
ncbi:sensor histidine kinase [Longimicrobium sp.]|uniref:sensor histidine kinase n=1 Tax=Longimicrobium sp. TaxID=2029185 RepID=UPI002E2FE371|nr:sensor histidine kinase [Longimicrobium sp.]HEX6041753.1 sensor histidine kinase [Longimicrobium sp.]